ncbi:MAG: hypothetical protein ACKO2K_04200 [Alphaproteobacteria bacterium]
MTAKPGTFCSCDRREMRSPVRLVSFVSMRGLPTGSAISAASRLVSSNATFTRFTPTPSAGSVSSRISLLRPCR